MKKTFHLFILAFILLLTIQPIFAQLNLPEPSPAGHLKQEVGYTDITVTYSRPGAKGRKIFGALVPYDKLWRTGASEATKIRFYDSVTIEGNKLAAGAYSLFSIPGEKEWTIIINKDSSMHGTSNYTEEHDVLRFKVKPEPAPRYYETFTIEVNDIIKNTAQVFLLWENTQVKFNVTTNADERVMAEINERINVKKEDRPGLYYQSALYYFNNNKDLSQALQWIQKAVKADEDFNYLQLQARIQAELKDYKTAIRSAKRSSELAKAKKWNDVVSKNEQLIEEWTAEMKAKK
jgi:tetratricopeptide (TPR) repeat protein